MAPTWKPLKVPQGAKPDAMVLMRRTGVMQCSNPAHRARFQESRGTLIVAVAALTIALFGPIIPHARGAEMQFEQSVPTIGRVTVVNIGARGLWPPDDMPRANWAFLALVFSACTVGAYDVPPSPLGRGPVHWLWARCEW